VDKSFDLIFTTAKEKYRKENKVQYLWEKDSLSLSYLDECGAHRLTEL